MVLVMMMETVVGMVVEMVSVMMVVVVLVVTVVMMVVAESLQWHESIPFKVLGNVTVSTFFFIFMLCSFHNKYFSFYANIFLCLKIQLILIRKVYQIRYVHIEDSSKSTK